MIPVSKDIINAASFFQTVFSIVIALSIGEAFKQFIADSALKPEDRAIHWIGYRRYSAFFYSYFHFFTA
jgi:hypothetical protein